VHFIEDGILTQSLPDRTEVFRSVNGGELMASGLNLSVFLVEIPRWFAMRATYSFLPLAKDTQTGEPLTLRATHSGRVEWLGTWLERRLESRLSVSARSALNVPSGSPAAPAYAALGAGIAWRAQDWLRISFDVENLLNQTNATWGPMPGIHGVLNVKLSTS
jgi:outer membrane receptor protein involved in Fe transport